MASATYDKCSLDICFVQLQPLARTWRELEREQRAVTQSDNRTIKSRPPQIGLNGEKRSSCRKSRATAIRDKQVAGRFAVWLVRIHEGSRPSVILRASLPMFPGRAHELLLFRLMFHDHQEARQILTQVSGRCRIQKVQLKVGEDGLIRLLGVD